MWSLFLADEAWAYSCRSVVLEVCTLWIRDVVEPISTKSTTDTNTSRTSWITSTDCWADIGNTTSDPDHESSSGDCYAFGHAAESAKIFRGDANGARMSDEQHEHEHAQNRTNLVCMWNNRALTELCSMWINCLHDQRIVMAQSMQSYTSLLIVSVSDAQSRTEDRLVCTDFL